MKRRSEPQQFPAEMVSEIWRLIQPRLRRRPLLLGVSGVQGSGKSTLTRQLVETAQAAGVPAVGFSLDDFYLTRRERQRLAREVHPLLATRGVPGTHDVRLLERTLQELAQAKGAQPARIPRFDKARDTRLAPSRWRAIAFKPRLIVLEGWCVGAPPQLAHDLIAPVNVLERDEDRDGRWRRWANERLAAEYAALWKRIDYLLLLRAPEFAVVRRWRGQAEAQLRRARPAAKQTLDRGKLARFVAHFERLSRHALLSIPACADCIVTLDARRRATIEHALNRPS